MTQLPLVFEGREVRVVERDGEVWFVAADVCNILEIDNVSQAVGALDIDESSICTIETEGGARDALTVDESGLYSLILRSRKPNAKTFRKWVTREVLPSIRRTGQYAVDQRPEIPIDPWNRDWKGTIDPYCRDNLLVALRLLGVTLATDSSSQHGKGPRAQYILGWRGQACLPFVSPIYRDILRVMKARLLFDPPYSIAVQAMKDETQRNRYDKETGELYINSLPTPVPKVDTQLAVADVGVPLVNVRGLLLN